MRCRGERRLSKSTGADLTPRRRTALDKAPEAFRTISEVADELEVPKHVLRFWEAKFAQLKPMKRGGGRRYYRPEDVALLRGIRFLLYNDGYTIQGRTEDPARARPALRDGLPAHRRGRGARRRDVARARFPTSPPRPRKAATRPDAASRRAIRSKLATSKTLGALLEEIEACRRILLWPRNRPLPAVTACFDGLSVYIQSAWQMASERSAARLAHRSGGPGVGSSNLPAPTIKSIS